MQHNTSSSNNQPPRRKSHTVGDKVPLAKPEKLEKYDFEKMKTAATHEDPLVRKAAFSEYFERFNEFPSFLFDNDSKIDARLAQTMQDLAVDESSSKELLEGVRALRNRLPSWS